jgi:hypothetical protein
MEREKRIVSYDRSCGNGETERKGRGECQEIGQTVSTTLPDLMAKNVGMAETWLRSKEARIVSHSILLPPLPRTATQ